MKSLSAGLVALQTAVRQYRRPALAGSSCSVLRGAGGWLSSARATVQLQDAPIGIAIDQLPFTRMLVPPAREAVAVPGAKPVGVLVEARRAPAGESESESGLCPCLEQCPGFRLS